MYKRNGLHICTENLFMNIGNEQVFTKGKIYDLDNGTATNDEGRSGHILSTWGEKFFVSIEAAMEEYEKTTYGEKVEAVGVAPFADFVQGTDFDLLAEQKTNLVEIATDIKKHLSKKDASLVDGVIHFIDSFQDMLEDEYNLKL